MGTDIAALVWPRTNPDNGYDPHICGRCGGNNIAQCEWEGHLIRQPTDELPHFTNFSAPQNIQDLFKQLPEYLLQDHYKLLKSLTSMRKGDLAYQQLCLKTHVQDTVRCLQQEKPVNRIHHLCSLMDLVEQEYMSMGNLNENAFSGVLTQYHKMLEHELNNQVTALSNSQGKYYGWCPSFNRVCTVASNVVSHLRDWYKTLTTPTTPPKTHTAPENIQYDPYYDYLDNILIYEYGLSEQEIDAFFGQIKLYDEDERTVRAIVKAWVGFKSQRPSSPRNLTNFMRLYEWGFLTVDQLRTLSEAQNQYDAISASYHLLIAAGICNSEGRQIIR
ncbi:hypothetical protein M3P05_11030 [Sansalvadorimonas sp. 2012CJ34-2]|uniref:Ubiquitin conjugation factor E4 core domain-containing protein n=1 Tax=Parendozoicomonas callyspongiae TaxID=2942213 RepID=A0ABT0PGE2_9GAMM|nr:hypothetical protein [Sansalvadorimonas sp. 2012CJ34-2]MCL6270454.1 hypothetical protein [Sansalvadorimonas sp. 2012CJ34-2]